MTYIFSIRLLAYSFLLFLFCSSVLLADSFSCNSAVFPSSIHQRIERVLAQHPDVPGIVVALHHPDQGNHVIAIGKNIQPTNAPMQFNQVFDIGSIHKLFKWILLERMASDGLLELNDEIGAYISSEIFPNATISMLANHSTGMIDISQNVISDAVARYENGSYPHEYTFSEMMGFLASENNNPFSKGFRQGFKQGTHINYSSYGPVVAGHIAETISGSPTNDLVRQYILVPLKMTDTSFVGYDDKPINLAQGYGSREANSPNQAFGSIPQGLLLSISSAHKGAMYSTACDLLNFVTAISDPQHGFLNAELIESRIELPIGDPGSIEVGRGVFRYHQFYDGNFWVHAGDGIHSHSSLVAYNPDTGVAVVILANLKSKFIENEYGLHFDILTGIESAFR